MTKTPFQQFVERNGGGPAFPTMEEVIARTMKPITVESELDDGGWRVSTFANESAAVDFERRMAKRGVATRRPSH